MFLNLTEDYIAAKFYQYCGQPTYNRQQGNYQGSCPICREGKSWLRKKRCYYIVKKNIVCCHNCGWYSNTYNWIIRVTGFNFKEIKEDFEKCDGFIERKDKKTQIIKKVSEDLPRDSINLFDSDQIEYYKHNKIVHRCLELIVNRRLDHAINKPKALFTTLNDPVHSSRLIIPFYDIDNKIIFYQSRETLGDKERPRYLSKVGSEKSLYGVNSIDETIENIFITEGPIDAMFLKNGLAVSGINESRYNTFTSTQQRQLLQLTLYKKIWVLDNQFNDTASKNKTKKLLQDNHNVFIWPKSMKEYKDINEYCVNTGCNSFDTDFILENTYTGLKGILLLSSY